MGIRDTIGKLFGGGGKPPPSGGKDALQRTSEARNAAWSAIGALEPDVIGHLVNPALMGETPWPGLSRAYAVIRRGGQSVILATDGLSNPFDDGSPGNGFGHELFIETSDIPDGMRGDTGNVADLGRTWVLALLAAAAGLDADNGGIGGAIETYGAISTEFPGVVEEPRIAEQVPARFITEDGGIGILIGQPRPDFDDTVKGAPLSPIRLLPIVLLTAAELDYLREGGRAAREEIAQRLAASPSGHRCDLNRPSLV